jgi:hypothetical protein
MLRTAVNVVFKTEMKLMDYRRRETSMEATLSETYDLSLEDLLSKEKLSSEDDVSFIDEIDAKPNKALDGIARQISKKCIKLMTHEEIVLLTADFNKIKRSDPVLLEYFQTNTSHVSDVLNKNIPKKIKNFFPKDMDVEDLKVLSKLIIEKLKLLSLSLLASEKSVQPLLKYLKQRKTK